MSADDADPATGGETVAGRNAQTVELRGVAGADGVVGESVETDFIEADGAVRHETRTRYAFDANGHVIHGPEEVRGRCGACGELQHRDAARVCVACGEVRCGRDAWALGGESYCSGCVTAAVAKRLLFGPPAPRAPEQREHRRRT